MSGGAIKRIKSEVVDTSSAVDFHEAFSLLDDPMFAPTTTEPAPLQVGSLVFFSNARF